MRWAIKKLVGGEFPDLLFEEVYSGSGTSANITPEDETTYIANLTMINPEYDETGFVAHTVSAYTCEDLFEMTMSQKYLHHRH